MTRTYVPDKSAVYPPTSPSQHAVYTTGYKAPASPAHTALLSAIKTKTKVHIVGAQQKTKICYGGGGHAVPYLTVICNQCNKCEDHCTCPNKCEEHWWHASECSTCDTCMDCCSCVRCPSCMSTGDTYCDACGVCPGCCECSCDCDDFFLSCDCATCQDYRTRYKRGQAISVLPWVTRGIFVTNVERREFDKTQYSEIDPLQGMADFYLLSSAYLPALPTMFPEDVTAWRVIEEQAAARRRQLVDSLDAAFQEYLGAAIGGELRHHRLMRRAEGMGGVSRERCWEHWPSYVEQVGPRVYLDAEALFLDGTMASSYGGKPWATAAKVMHMRITGEIEPWVFVDRVFSMQHNTGSILNKVEWKKANKQLATSPLNLCQAVGDAHAATSPDLHLMAFLASEDVRELVVGSWTIYNRARRAMGLPMEERPQPQRAVKGSRLICNGKYIGDVYSESKATKKATVDLDLSLYSASKSFHAGHPCKEKVDFGWYCSLPDDHPTDVPHCGFEAHQVSMSNLDYAFQKSYIKHDTPEAKAVYEYISKLLTPEVNTVPIIGTWEVPAYEPFAQKCEKLIGILKCSLKCSLPSDHEAEHMVYISHSPKTENLLAFTYSGQAFIHKKGGIVPSTLYCHVEECDLMKGHEGPHCKADTTHMNIVELETMADA